MSDNIRYAYLNMDSKTLCKTQQELIEQIGVGATMMTGAHGKTVIYAGGHKYFTESNIKWLYNKLIRDKKAS